MSAAGCNVCHVSKPLNSAKTHAPMDLNMLSHDFLRAPCPCKKCKERARQQREARVKAVADSPTGICGKSAQGCGRQRPSTMARSGPGGGPAMGPGGGGPGRGPAMGPGGGGPAMGSGCGGPGCGGAGRGAAMGPGGGGPAMGSGYSGPGRGPAMSPGGGGPAMGSGCGGPGCGGAGKGPAMGPGGGGPAMGSGYSGPGRGSAMGPGGGGPAMGSDYSGPGRGPAMGPGGGGPAMCSGCGGPGCSGPGCGGPGRGSAMGPGGGGPAMGSDYSGPGIGSGYGGQGSEPAMDSGMGLSEESDMDATCSRQPTGPGGGPGGGPATGVGSGVEAMEPGTGIGSGLETMEPGTGGPGAQQQQQTADGIGFGPQVAYGRKSSQNDSIQHVEFGAFGSNSKEATMSARYGRDTLGLLVHLRGNRGLLNAVHGGTCDKHKNCDKHCGIDTECSVFCKRKSDIGVSGSCTKLGSNAVGYRICSNEYLNLLLNNLLEVVGILVFFAICTIVFWLKVGQYVGQLALDLINADRSIKVAVGAVFAMLLLAYVISLTNPPCGSAKGCGLRIQHNTAAPLTPHKCSKSKKAVSAKAVSAKSVSIKDRLKEWLPWWFGRCRAKNKAACTKAPRRYTDRQGRAIFDASRRTSIPTEMKQPPTWLIWLRDVFYRS